jgi:hypothetical protein
MSAAHKSKTSAIAHQARAQLYERFVTGIKQRIHTAQIKTAVAANAELVFHYWDIRNDILAVKKEAGGPLDELLRGTAK